MNPSKFVPPKRDFIGKPAPPGYVAGIGRGATGFTTRSDIGPAREAAAAAALAAAHSSQPSGSGLSLTRKQQQAKDDEEEEEEYLNDKNYDEFAGYGGSLVSKDPYEEDDEEADKIYEEIDRHLDERGKALREAKTRQELERYRQERPKIQQQFSDLKSQLKEVSEAEWMSIPDVGDARNRKQRVARQDKFTPLPDSLLAHQARLASGGEQLVYIDPKATEEEDDDDDDDDDVDDGDDDKETNGGRLESKDNKQLAVQDASRTKSVNIEEISEIRSNQMKLRLNQLSAQQSLQDGEDGHQLQQSRDYLTNLESMNFDRITDAATLKMYRKQFASLRATNPSFPNAWIASVRLEEAAGKLTKARSLILEACSKCPKSADLWCEATRLHPSDFAQSLMVKALKENPRSVKLWIKAADLEREEEKRRKVYAKARELVPRSVLLWKKSAELEKPDEAAVILRQAIECCPEAVELWLALARLVPYGEAKEVLVRASERHPAERSIWIMAAKLEEAATGNKSLVAAIVKRAVEQLSQSSSGGINRSEWFNEAMDAERAGSVITCHELIKRVIKWGVKSATAESEDGLTKRKEMWQEEANEFCRGGSVECARAVYEAMVSDPAHRKQESSWLAYVEFERKLEAVNANGDSDTNKNSNRVEALLRRAVQAENCLRSEPLWLMLAHERRHHLDEARQILSRGLDALPDSERIIIAAVQLECDNGNHKEARRILADACMSAKTPRLVVESAQLERTVGNLDEAVRMLRAGAEEYKSHAELYLMLGEIEEQRGQLKEAKGHYSNGLKFSPTSVHLWLHLAKAEERTGRPAQARSTLERARIRNPKCVQLWLEAAQLEVRDKKQSVATNILARGIATCKGQPEVERLYEEQTSISRRKRI